MMIAEQEHAANVRQLEELQQYRDRLAMQQRSLASGMVDPPGYQNLDLTGSAMAHLPPATTLSRLLSSSSFSAGSTGTAATHHTMNLAAPNTQERMLDSPARSKALEALLQTEQDRSHQLQQLQQLRHYRDHLGHQQTIPGPRMPDTAPCHPTLLSEPESLPKPTPAKLASLKKPPPATHKVSDGSTTATSTSNEQLKAPEVAAAAAPEEKAPSTPKQKPKKKDTKWLNTLEELKEYKEEHGDCIVPRGYSHNPRLASWVAEQRFVNRSNAFCSCNSSIVCCSPS